MKRVACLTALAGIPLLTGLCQMARADISVSPKRYGNNTPTGTAYGQFNATGIATDAAGDVYVCGWYAPSSGYDEGVIIEYSSTGTLEDTDYYSSANGNVQYSAISVYQPTSGGPTVYVCGYTTGSSTGQDFLTVAYDDTLTRQWSKTYDNSSLADWATNLTTDSSGNAYVCGATTTSSAQEYGVVKYNSSGTQQWAETWDYVTATVTGEGIVDTATGIVLDSSGNVWVTGNAEQLHIYGGDTSIYQIGAIMLDPSAGSLQLYAIYLDSGSPGQDVKNPSTCASGPHPIVADGSGDVYVVGSHWSTSTAKEALVVLEYDSSETGNVPVWAVTDSYESGGAYGNAITTDGSGEVYAVGYTFGGGNGEDIQVDKVTDNGSSGALAGDAIWNNSSENGDDIGVDCTYADGALFLTGYTTVDGSGDTCYITQKYSTSLSLD